MISFLSHRIALYFKRTISLLTSLILLCSMPLADATAESKTDLRTLASSLGADTDFFNFPNYRATEVSDELVELINSQGEVYAEGALQDCYSGLCNAFAVLEVLNHNGVISPSDLQNGAITLHDIEFNSDVNDILCYYSVLQGYRLQDLVYHEYFCSHDLTEQCQDLIKYGENAVETGKYFFIAFTGTNISHAIVGIGIADGSWSFNGKDYDKCILTLDSNFQKKSDSSQAAGFVENACIYINSERNEFYFPAYDSDSANEDTFITLISDDTDMLNYKGYVNPSESYDPKYELIKDIEIHHSNCGEYDLSIELNGETETYHGYPNKAIEGLTKNVWSPLGEQLGAKYFRSADSITVETMQNSNELLTLVIYEANKDMEEVYIKGKSRVTIDENTYTLTNLGENDAMYDFYPRRVLTSAIPYKGYGVVGYVQGTITMQVENDGIILSSTDDSIKSSLHFSTFNDTLDYCDFKVFAVNDVKVCCKEDSDEIYFAIGEGFDVPVETGDVDCNGSIDARDASYILSEYANASTKRATYLNQQLADYDGNGTVDARDASAVLSEYARMSTTKV